MPTVRGRTAITVTARPAQQIVSRAAMTWCSTPSTTLRTWQTFGCLLDERSGSVMLEHVWDPSKYAWGKDDYITLHGAIGDTDKSLWIDSSNALQRGDKAVGWVGSTTVPNTTPWYAILDTTHQLGRCQGVSMSFLWYRPANDMMASLKFYPRIDMGHYVDSGGTRVYFTPFHFAIDQQMRLRVYEYPYDNYDAFASNPQMVLTESYTHPLTISADDMASAYHTIQIQAVSDDDILVTSDVLAGGGFLYRSALDRANIYMLPAGIAAIQCTTGGAGQVQITPLETATSGYIESEDLSKESKDAVYPTLKVFGWSPSLINTDRGFMTGETIATDVNGTGGINYEVYAIDSDTDILVDPAAVIAFQKYYVKIGIYPTSNVSPVINDLLLDFAGTTAAVDETVTTISDDVMSLSGQVGTDNARKFSMKVRNRTNAYNTIAERVMNEVDVNIGASDFCVLYTTNPSYEWYKTPSNVALELNWELVDGMGYLEGELCANETAYDGQILSTALTEFLGRHGFDATRLDIDLTDGSGTNPTIRLPKKKGKEPYQFKPEDGTPCADFIKKLCDWFQADYALRAGRAGKIEFKAIAKVADEITIARTYYPKASYKVDADDHMIYQGVEVEILMDQFYNEIWVVGEDKRTVKPLVAVYQNKPSQNDKTSPDYIGRRRLMIILTKLPLFKDCETVLREYVKFFGKKRSRVKFNTRMDPLLQVHDFINLYGVALTWRVQGLDYDISPQTVADSNINSTTPPIRGMKVSAIQWPVEA